MSPEEDREECEALVSLAQQLAQAIVRDGEGATKFITVRVEGGRTKEECRQVAYAIAHSPLVKTAFFASDPNLGRILAAVGNAGIAEIRAEREIEFGDEAQSEEEQERIALVGAVDARVLATHAWEDSARGDWPPNFPADRRKQYTESGC